MLDGPANPIVAFLGKKAPSGMTESSSWGRGLGARGSALDRTRNPEICTMVYWLGFTFCRSRAPAPAVTRLHRAREWWHPALRVAAVHRHKRPIELRPVGCSAKLQKQESQRRATIAAHSARWHARQIRAFIEGIDCPNTTWRGCCNKNLIWQKVAK